MDPSRVSELKAFVDACKKDPAILADPSLAFFRDYLASLGADLPQAATKPTAGPKMGDPSVEVTEESRYASQEAKGMAMEAMSEGKLEEAVEHLTKAILLNPTSAIMYGTRGMDKYHSSTRFFAPLKDAPFALRGCSNSSFNNMDGLRHSSSIGQAKGYTSSPLGALRQKMSPSGSRSLYTSRPLSAPVANRPLSPHLPMKNPQLSATFSISHRIFGVALGAAIISIPLATKFSLMFDV